MVTFHPGFQSIIIASLFLCHFSILVSIFCSAHACVGLHDCEWKIKNGKTIKETDLALEENLNLYAEWCTVIM